MTRQKPGTFFTKFNNTGAEQNMPQGNNWKELLDDTEYKDESLKVIK